jgi:hypothetical protein
MLEKDIEEIENIVKEKLSLYDIEFFYNDEYIRNENLLFIPQIGSNIILDYKSFDSYKQEIWKKSLFKITSIEFILDRYYRTDRQINFKINLQKINDIKL